MDHERIARVAESRLKPVWVTEVERQVVLGIWVQHAGVNMIEALRRLAIAVLFLRTQLPGPSAHRIDLQKRKLATAVAFPDL